MYFGPALEVKKKSEFWHGDLWGESPQFGQETIVIKQGIYFDIQLFKFCKLCIYT